MRLIIMLSLLLLASAPTLRAGGAGPNSLPKLLQDADVIVVGTMLDGSSTASGYSFSVSVNRVLKGSVQPGAVLSADWTVKPPVPLGSSAQQMKHEADLWFLRQAGLGKFAVLPVQFGAGFFSEAAYGPAPVPLPPAFAYSETTALPDRVVWEIGGIVSTAGHNSRTHLLLVNSAMLDLFAPSASHSVSALWADSNTPDVVIAGLKGLLRQGEVSALETLETKLPILERSQLFPFLVSDLEGHYRNPDPAGVLILGKLFANAAEGSNLQYATARILSSMHTPETLPILASLLDSKTKEIQYEGVSGLASFANGRPMQRPDNTVSMAYLQKQANAPYRTADTEANDALGNAVARDEARYIGFWKSWWAQNRAKLGFAANP